MSSLLVLTALGEDRPGIIADLTSKIARHDCNITDSRMSLLGGEFAIIMLIDGQWNNIAKLEDALPAIEAELGIRLSTKRTEARAANINAIPYTVEVLAMDGPGIVHRVTKFFAARNINIHDVESSCFNAPHTGTPMFTLNMTIEVPAKMHIASLREDFMEFSDEYNLDAIIEPVKT